jgi:hypothetical protein
MQTHSCPTIERGAVSPQVQAIQIRRCRSGQRRHFHVHAVERFKQGKNKGITRQQLVWADVVGNQVCADVSYRNHHADRALRTRSPPPSLLIDGLTNSTQDEIFSLHRSFTGQQMMFTMSFLSLVITLPILVLPPDLLPQLAHFVGTYLPFPLPSPLQPPTSAFHDVSPLAHSLIFIQTHPSCILPLIQFALLGGLGQLFIFETISHFGSLTLVMLTVTRKLFTMLLSVVLFEHTLTTGQWAGVAVVFGGIGLEAAMKRKGERVMQTSGAGTIMTLIIHGGPPQKSWTSR